MALVLRWLNSCFPLIVITRIQSSPGLFFTWSLPEGFHCPELKEVFEDRMVPDQKSCVTGYEIVVYYENIARRLYIHVPGDHMTDPPLRVFLPARVPDR